MDSTSVKGRGLFYALHELYRLMRRRFEFVSQPYDLTFPQWRALSQLYRRDGLSQAELAGLIDSDPMTLSGMMERLEAKNFVERRPDPKDSRAKVVLITETARDVVAAMKAEMTRTQEQVLEGLSESERDHLIDILQRLSVNLAATMDKETSQ
ncbi:MAG: MarR family transcriptional regulator [Hyphomicrobiaceae bacterium]|nr:MarR family transcriptional regulator [Hyphomicrobiaceae bacterium]